MKMTLFVRRISQKTNHHFSIEWNDGHRQDFKLSDLQKNCPCAHCRDEFTGESLVDPRTLLEEVKAIAISSVGRYGLRVQFTSGCSAGIYSFDYLRQME